VLAAAPIQTSYKEKKGLSKVSFEQQHLELKIIQSAERRRRSAQGHSGCKAQNARRRAQRRRSDSLAAAGESGASALFFFMTIDKL
jgi:hypothetical protein